MSSDNNNDILISIVIINYKVPHCLVEALRSLRLAKHYEQCEVIVVDNASGDNSREIVASEFEEVQWIQLKTNIGFGKACNIGVEAAHGEYLLLLNPDTIISSNTLADAVEFMETYPKAGLMGPKILNPDGTLQLSCRRSIPTPSVAFYYFTGLSELFPKSKRFGSYHLTYMDEDETAQVDVISGSFMFMRRGLFNDIGGFDKRFFMYGEDIDLCYRITRAGFEVWYYPQIKIVHQKGKSSAKRRIRSRFYFYEAMLIFSRKYRAVQDTFFPWWLMWVGIVFQAGLNIGATLARSFIPVLIDLAAINAAVWGGLKIVTERMGLASPYTGGLSPTLAGAHAAVSFMFISLFLYNGIYRAGQYSLKNIFFSGVLSSAVLLSWFYFMTDHSRYMTEAGIVLGLVAAATILWREVLPTVVRGIKRLLFATDRVLVIGNDNEVSQYIKSNEGRRTSRIAGIIRLGKQIAGNVIEGYPVVGGMDDIEQYVEGGKVDTLLIVAAQPWYSEVIGILVKYRNRRDLNIRWEAMEL